MRKLYSYTLELQYLENIRSHILSKSLETKKAVYDKIGLEFNIDSQKELSIVLNKNLDLQQFVGSKRITLAQGGLLFMKTKRNILLE